MKKIRSLNQLLYEVSVYSFKKNVEVDCNKFKLQYLSDLADHQNVKTAYCNEYGLVALYDEEKNLNMVIQVWSKDGESAEKATIDWLNYLNIVSQSDDSDAKVEENKEQTESNINESNPTGWSFDKCKQLVQRMYDNLSEWAKDLLPEEDLPVVWGEKMHKDRYIVSDANAIVRVENGYKLAGSPTPTIPQGTEVKDVEFVTKTVDGRDVECVKVTLVGTEPKQLHYTAASNLTKIEVLEKPEKKEIKRTVKSVRLPFANEESREIKESEEYYVVAKCGSYLRISENKTVSWENCIGDWVFEYSFVSVEESIDLALSVLEGYIEKPTGYAQQTGAEYRVAETSEGLEKMDCTELACRFLKVACGLEKAPLMSSSEFSNIANGGASKIIQYVNNSNKETYTDIRPGDIFLWKIDGGSGHVGVVKSYDPVADVVTVIEAISSSGSAEERIQESGTCKGCVRESKYTRTGNALWRHDGWKGYFRPIINQ